MKRSQRMARTSLLIAGFVTVSLVAGSTIVVAAPAGHSDVAQLDDETTQTATTTLQFENQTLVNDTVTVASVNLSDGGFVAIYNSSGSLLGVSTYLEPGSHENVTVNVTRPLETPDRDRDRTRDGTGDQTQQQNQTRTTTLIAIAHQDTNANQTFDYIASGGVDDGPYVADGLVLDDAVVTVEPQRINQSA